MLRLEDKTLNSIRVVSNKEAIKNGGSIVSNGGAYIAKNIECDGRIVSNEAIIRGSVKIADSLSVGNMIYCPDLYGIDNDTIRFRRCLVPGRPKNPISKTDLSTLGTKLEPWETIYARCIETESLTIVPGQIDIKDNLNIIHPQTNDIMARIQPGYVESNVPIYQRWTTLDCDKITYVDNMPIEIISSTIFLEIGSVADINLYLDAKNVPDSIWIKIYFFNQGKNTVANYNIKINWCDKDFAFGSDTSSSRIKLAFVDNIIYCM